MTATLRIGSDIGGTFTDVVLASPHGIRVEKVLTTPKDLAQGVLQGVQRILAAAGADLAAVGACVHGTTLAANTLIERRGEPLALLTTAGFRDVLEIGNADRYDSYDLQLEKPEPLVPRELRLPVRERIRADGSVEIPLDEADVRAAVEAMRERGLRAVAIAFLHGYRNPAHERRAAAIVAEMLPGAFVSLSSDVAPEIREFERTSTTVANVYVRPIVERYLRSLERGLGEAGFAGQLLVMLSDGGTCTVETACQLPIRIVESGPAAGALAAAHHARRAGLARLLSFDMGGTTAKAALVEDGRPQTTRDFEAARLDRFKRGSGLPIKVPVIEMIEIGAGGGSIARLDRMGLLKVGPESAGSDPGPACYDLGGRRPTVTDADLVLGYVDAGYFLGGEMRLNAAAAREAIDAHVGRPLGLDTVAAAWGIHRLVNENMAGAARIHAIERGRDVRGYSLFAFGGAGPVHACHVAEILGLDRVVVPPGAGVASAFGMLTAPLSFSIVRSHTRRLDEMDWAELGRLLGGMRDEGMALLARSGVPPAAARVEASADMRYRGQTSEIAVPLPPLPLSAAAAADIVESFERTYRLLYQRLNPALAVEAVTWRVTVSGPDPDVPAWSGPATAAAARPKGRRPVYLDGGFHDVPVFDRYGLAPGTRLPGPAIVEERESTIVVTGAFEVHVADSLDVVLRRRQP